MFCDRIKGACTNGGDEGFCSEGVEVIDKCEGDLLENLSHLALWYLSLLCSNNS